MTEQPAYTEQFDFRHVIDMFPALAFFALTGETLARMLSYLLFTGTPPERLQEILDGDEFAVHLAGSVYSQLTGNPRFGCDGGRDNGR